ncbi:hypothetical protein COCVIDRAFT_96941 [Bipolaris victoriae FI3]|uniref:Uncharacterized protein n=1 Tax=Bipolaris victoriae (strain FI3) TaxID=930091 RepID=W7ELU1_BIPV3|nr:hypothetical protein COCVIDRAFT_96941 [Bipolaris victoriae FI3]
MSPPDSLPTRQERSVAPWRALVYLPCLASQGQVTGSQPAAIQPTRRQCSCFTGWSLMAGCLSPGACVPAICVNVR